MRSGRFPVAAWELREVGLDFDDLARSESLFALSNGHIGVRGNLDEGDPRGLPGTYLNSFYETRPLPYAEAGFGFPEDGQTILNVTNGKVFRLHVDDEPVDLRYGEVLHHNRVLSLRTGVLHRVVEWRSPSGQVIRLRTKRLVSLTQRSIFAVNWEIEAVGDSARVVVQSELVANEHVPAQSRDPRVAAIMENALEALAHGGEGTRAFLLHGTKRSKLRMAAAMDHLIHAPDGYSYELDVREDWARLMVGSVLQPGERLGLTKFVAYGWSSQRSMHALSDQVAAALVAARHAGWDQIEADQKRALDLFWECADVEIDGAPGAQQAVRVALFHTFQAGARAEQRTIPAKGLTGPGYDGHAFWDTESFVLPVLIATAPHAARDALRWRWSTLDLARERATQLHLRGAVFPWRTIRGQECSGYWPAGTAAMHINADIAGAVQRYVDWTGDDDFYRDYGMELLVETARLWMSLGYFGADARFHIDGVTGPDEYSAVVRDNIYTNLMAVRNLAAAATAAQRWPQQAVKLDVQPEEIEAWRAAAAVPSMPYDEKREVHEQDRGFTDREVWDFERTAQADGYPLLLNAPYFEIYRKQVIKQADLMLAMHWCGDSFTAEEKARAFAYYEPLTVRDSSLSACTQAVIAAEVGHQDLAAEYLAEAAMMDLHDLEHNTGDGLHIASLAGTWLAVVAGFGGMRDHGGQLSFRPQLPRGWNRLRFRLVWRGARVLVCAEAGEVSYEVTHCSDEGIEIVHCGETVRVVPGEKLTRPMAAPEPLTNRPAQPVGREPLPADSLE
ncbi:MAG: family 65 glycosyl hydrolase [Actinomycetota bacterium]|nr:family 65 glycosyl hydrolase [Actinomycetota bacterium]